MRTRIDFELDQIQRESQLRRLGRDLHEHAAAISDGTTDAMAAVVSMLASTTDYGQLLSEGFAEAMMTQATTRHLRVDG